MNVSYTKFILTICSADDSYTETKGVSADLRSNKSNNGEKNESQ